MARQVDDPPTADDTPPGSYSLLNHSVCSPRVVDYEAPGAVCLTTENIRGSCRQLHPWQAHWTPEGFRPITQKGSKTRLVACDPSVVGARGIGLVFAELGASKVEIAGRLQAKWRYAVKAAKVPHYRFHDLRHTYGTRLRRSGKTYSDIAAIMGITEAMAHVYAHEDTERIQREAFAEPVTNRSLLQLATLS